VLNLPRRNLKLIEEILKRKKLLTLELVPTSGPDLSNLIREAKTLRCMFDAFNVTELIMRKDEDLWMNTFYTAVKLREEGLIAIPHMTCREHNRRGALSDLLMGMCGGITDVLVVTGDRYKEGEGVVSKEVFELSVIDMIKLVKQVYSRFSMDVTVLVAANSACGDLKAEVKRTAEKLEAGATVIQTQPIYDVDVFREYMELLEQAGCKPKVLAGVLPLKSARSIKFLENKLGIKVPEDIRVKFSGLSKEEMEREGVEIALKIIKAVINFCDGVHVFSMGDPVLASNLMSRLNL
jgi:5,10-methylenetetrahydrofolate reductase